MKNENKRIFFESMLQSNREQEMGKHKLHDFKKKIVYANTKISNEIFVEKARKWTTELNEKRTEWEKEKEIEIERKSNGWSNKNWNKQAQYNSEMKNERRKREKYITIVYFICVLSIEIRHKIYQLKVKWRKKNTRYGCVKKQNYQIILWI